MNSYSKKGYLTSNFRIFHLSDTNLGEIDFHYHDFHKLLIHLKGDTSYCIEGQTFDLAPNDIVFVNAGEVHRPIFHSSAEYERIIIYISPDFLSSYQHPGNDLTLCFKQAQANGTHVLRIPQFPNSKMGSIVHEFEESLTDSSYANELYQQTLFLEFMVHLNRATISQEILFIPTVYSNSKIADIVSYIDSNLAGDLSVDSLAKNFYLSRYYLMHSFKENTGYTLGSYISTKRLAHAQSLINAGVPITDACLQCGFSNYSSFLRSYRKHFGHAPSEKSSSSAPLQF